MTTNPNLPTEPEALWALLADVLTALEEAGEDPKLEPGHDWREQYKDHTPGIRRSPADGRWHRMVEWTNASGAWRWTATEDGTWQWPHAERLTTLAEKAATLAERADEDADEPYDQARSSEGDWAADVVDFLREVSGA